LRLRTLAETAQIRPFYLPVGYSAAWDDYAPYWKRESVVV